jgi:endonuclease YncB( thermonuclease family)
MANRVNRGTAKEMRLLRSGLAAACIGVLLPAPAGEAADLSGPAQAIDGGSIEIAGATVRLHGVLPPSRGQSCTRGGQSYDCAQEAGWALADRLGRHWVRCIERAQDNNSRIVATCYIGADIDVNAHMVQSGWALARRDEAPDYIPLEDAARAAQRGLWMGRFDPSSQPR